jgi:flagellar biosynthesis protein FlhG
MREFRPRIIVNEVRTAEDVKLGFSVGTVCKKYFGFDSEYVGYVNYDELARRSVQARQPIVALHSDADASIYLQRIARKLMALRGREAPPAATDPPTGSPGTQRGKLA